MRVRKRRSELEILGFVEISNEDGWNCWSEFLEKLRGIRVFHEMFSTPDVDVRHGRNNKLSDRLQHPLRGYTIQGKLTRTIDVPFSLYDVRKRLSI